MLFEYSCIDLVYEQSLLSLEYILKLFSNIPDSGKLEKLLIQIEIFLKELYIFSKYIF